MKGKCKSLCSWSDSISAKLLKSSISSRQRVGSRILVPPCSVFCAPESYTIAFGGCYQLVVGWDHLYASIDYAVPIIMVAHYSGVVW